MERSSSGGAVPAPGDVGAEEAAPGEEAGGGVGGPVLRMPQQAGDAAGDVVDSPGESPGRQFAVFGVEVCATFAFDSVAPDRILVKRATVTMTRTDQ